MYNQEKQCFVHKRDQQNSSRNPVRRILQHAIIVEHAERFWQKALNARRESSNVSYRIQKQYHQGLLLDKYVSIVIPKLSFAKSVFEKGYSASASRRRLLVWVEQKPTFFESKPPQKVPFTKRNPSRLFCWYQVDH